MLLKHKRHCTSDCIAFCLCLSQIKLLAIVLCQHARDNQFSTYCQRESSTLSFICEWSVFFTVHFLKPLLGPTLLVKNELGIPLKVINQRTVLRRREVRGTEYSRGKNVNKDVISGEDKNHSYPTESSREQFELGGCAPCQPSCRPRKRQC